MKTREQSIQTTYQAVVGDEFASGSPKGGQVRVVRADDGIVFLSAQVRQPVELAVAQTGQVEGGIVRDKEREPLRADRQLNATASSTAAVRHGGPGGQIGAGVQARPELHSFSIANSPPGCVDDGGRGQADL